MGCVVSTEELEAKLKRKVFKRAKKCQSEAHLLLTRVAVPVLHEWGLL